MTPVHRVVKTIKNVRAEVYDINYLEHDTLLDITDLKQAYIRSIFRILDALDYLAQEMEYRDDHRM